jgi:peptidyl-prolyl cis-trans isomerase D
MLEFLRQNVGGVLGLAIIGALVFVFALSFGAQSEGWGKGQTVEIAAEVYGKAIPQADYEYAVNLGGGREVDRNSAEHNLIGRQALAGLVERQLLLEHAARAGISASRDEAEQSIVDNRFLLTVPIEELARRIQRSFFLDEVSAARILLEDGYRVRMSFAKEGGTFDLTGFQNWVRYSLGLTEDRFVEQQRLELIAQRARKLLVSGVRIAQQEVREAYERENDTVSIKYLRLSPAELTEGLEPTEDDLRAWIEGNREQVGQFYETNKFRYTNLEKQVRARHILLKVPEEAADEERAARRTEMGRVVARLRAGEEFAALARELSEDGSAAQGGDLDWNPRGRMVPEFDEAMFALEPGQVSDIVETKYGFHVIKCEGVREGNVTLEEASLEIAARLYRTAEGARLAAEAARGYLERLREGGTLDGLFVAAGDGADETIPPAGPGKVRTSPSFTRDAASIPGIGRAPEVVAAAFELTPEHAVASRVFDVQGDLVIIELAERSVPSDAEFEQRRGELTEKLLALKQASWLRDRIRDLTAEARQQGRIVADLPLAEAPDPGRRSPVGPAADLPFGPAAGGEAPVTPPPPPPPRSAEPRNAEDDGDEEDGE